MISDKIKDSINQPDLYKFLVSTGLIICIGSLVFPLFTRDVSDLMIDSSKYINTTEYAKEYYLKTIHNRTAFAENHRLYSIVGFCIGIISLIFGLIKWFLRQKVDDELVEKRNENEKNELTLKRFEFDEKMASMSANGNSQNDAGSNEEVPETNDPKEENHKESSDFQPDKTKDKKGIGLQFVSSSSGIRKTGADCENEVYKLTLSFNVYTHSFVQGLNLPRRGLIDIVAKSFDNDKMSSKMDKTDLLIEVVYLHKPDMPKVDTQLKTLARNVSVYRQSFSRGATGRIVFVLSDDLNPDKIAYKAFSEQVSVMASKYSSLKAITVYQRNIETLKKEWFFG